MSVDRTRVRNFCIIAHIDHGKSTLADRILEATNTLSDRERKDQFLDNMDLERERGITIKAQTARIVFQAADGEDYILNLIDTPGHVDFSYEVSRALAACEGALLIVDAAQGIEAQTLANAYLAVDANLELIPVVNKIDLPSADPDRVAQEIEDVVGLDAADVLLVSAKTGQGVPELLQAIVERIPPPAGDAEKPAQALVFDAWFDPYVGAVMLVRMMQGTLHRRERVKFMVAGLEHEITRLDVVDPNPRSVEELSAGEVGLVVAGVKNLTDVRIGDTITTVSGGAEEPLPGFQAVKPMVFSGLYPVDAEDYEDLKAALVKLELNDSSFSYEPETSTALGFGFRCGFLGFLHAEIVQERLEREYDLNLITTAPTVRYNVVPKDGPDIEIESPAALPDTSQIREIQEPVVLATIHVPSEHLGPVLRLCQDRRGIQKGMAVNGNRVQVRYELPLNEIVTDFHDRLKSVTRGYGSFDYDLIGFRTAALVKLDVLVNGDPVDALSLIVHRDKAYHCGAELTRKLKEYIPRQQFPIAIQAAIGTRVVARTTVRACAAGAEGNPVSVRPKSLDSRAASFSLSPGSQKAPAGTSPSGVEMERVPRKSSPPSAKYSRSPRYTQFELPSSR